MKTIGADRQACKCNPACHGHRSEEVSSLETALKALLQLREIRVMVPQEKEEEEKVERRNQEA